MRKLICLLCLLITLLGCSAINNSLSGGTGVGLGYDIPENASIR